MTEKLYKALRRTRCPCTDHPEPWFIPISCINDLVTAPTVQEILRESRVIHHLDIDDNVIQQVAQMVLHSARRLFAVLAYLKIGYKIRVFLQLKLSDDNLPLICKKNDEGGCFRLFLRDTLEEIDCGLDEEDIEEFDRRQKSMLAPTFSRQHTDCVEVHDNIVLPFPHLKRLSNWKSIQEISAGAYSEVTIHSIHSDHHDFWGGDQPQPVRTQILPPNLLQLALIASRKNSTLLQTRNLSLITAQISTNKCFGGRRQFSRPLACRVTNTSPSYWPAIA